MISNPNAALVGNPRASLVVMGVAGCGKSSLAAALADDQGFALIEGDAHHSASNREKMRQGVALTDADREGWLNTLTDLLRAQPVGAVLACSALKRAYRERLRQALPGLRFVFLDITREEALKRVAARASHFFSSSLVDSQFNTLEPPLGEAGVLRVDASEPIAILLPRITTWMLQPISSTEQERA